jgi:hypothetical protein
MSTNAYRGNSVLNRKVILSSPLPVTIVTSFPQRGRKKHLCKGSCPPPGERCSGGTGTKRGQKKFCCLNSISVIIYMIVSFLLVSKPVSGFESEIYGRRLIDIDEYSIEKYRPKTPEPRFGEYVPQEWRAFYRFQLLLNQQNPSWSPDGRHIVFSSNRIGSIQIYSIDYDGSHLRRLTSKGENKLPNWSRK